MVISSINEGLIPVPVPIKTMLSDAISYQILWWARDMAKNDSKKMRACAALAKTRLGRALPREHYKMPDNLLVITSYQIKMEDIPQRYRKMKPSFEKIMLVISWQTNKNTFGSWWNKHKALTIMPLSVEWFARWPNIDFDNLELLLDKVNETLDHELRHMMQYMFLTDIDPYQTDTKPDYAQHGDDYFTSQVEFDPTIASSAAEFVSHYKLLLSYNKKVDLGIALRKTVGMMKPDMFDGFNRDPFFAALRRKNDSRYNTAVKKFLAEVGMLLSN